MVKIIAGERIGEHRRLAGGCSAALLDENRLRISLIHRVDNDRLTVPGGNIEAGESLTEACEREAVEETGIKVKVKHLIINYTHPHLLLEFSDVNRIQLVVLHFEVNPIVGRLNLSVESSELESYSQAKSLQLDMSPLDHLQIKDTFKFQAATIVRDVF